MNLTFARFGVGLIAVLVVLLLHKLAGVGLTELTAITALITAVDTKFMSYVDLQITNHILKGLMNGRDDKSA